MSKISVAVFLVVVHLVGGNIAVESTVSSEKLLNAPPSLPATSLGSLYRSARDDYNSRRHCSNCGPGYERDMRNYGRQTGVTGYYSGMGPIEDDRNWYYRPEVFDDRFRADGAYRQPAYMGYDHSRYMNRVDERGGYGYPAMSMRTGYYDGGSSRMPYYSDMMRGYGYRGNGYDNLDPHYDYYVTQRGGVGPGGMNNRDRYYGSQGYYDDRMGYVGQYDQKNFRPWDQTYRGISGFDNSGRGYYFASRPSISSSSSLPPTPSPSSSMSAHASYHVQTQPDRSSGQEQHLPGRPSHGGYRPEVNHQHQTRPDRPDYEPSDSNHNCCRNHYAASGSYSQSNQGGSYAAHGPSGPSSISYATGGGAQRPSTSVGNWNYIASGTTAGVDDHHRGTSVERAGVNSNSHGSYGSPYAGSGQYSGTGSIGSNAHDYRGNRDSDQHRETDNRQQSFAYGGRPRPANLGDTSYLMERNRDMPDQTPDQSNEEDSNTRAKPVIASTISVDSSSSIEGNAESDMQNNARNS